MSRTFDRTNPIISKFGRGDSGSAQSTTFARIQDRRRPSGKTLKHLSCASCQSTRNTSKLSIRLRFNGSRLRDPRPGGLGARVPLTALKKNKRSETRVSNGVSIMTRTHRSVDRGDLMTSHQRFGNIVEVANQVASRLSQDQHNYQLVKIGSE